MSPDRRIVCPCCGMSTWVADLRHGVEGCALPGCDGFPLRQAEWMIERAIAQGQSWRSARKSVAVTMRGVRTMDGSMLAADVVRLRGEWRQRYEEAE